MEDILGMYSMNKIAAVTQKETAKVSLMEDGS